MSPIKKKKPIPGGNLLDIEGESKPLLIKAKKPNHSVEPYMNNNMID